MARLRDQRKRVISADYVDGAKHRDDLLRRLHQVRGLLAEVEQEAADPGNRASSGLDGLDGLAGRLGGKKLVSHQSKVRRRARRRAVRPRRAGWRAPRRIRLTSTPSPAACRLPQDVRLTTACCLCEIFRLYAPNAPYTTGELKVRGDPVWRGLAVWFAPRLPRRCAARRAARAAHRPAQSIFRLLVQQLYTLETNFDPCFSIVQSLAEVNTCCELSKHIDEEWAQSMLQSLYGCLFDIIRCAPARGRARGACSDAARPRDRPEHSSKLEAHMVDIVTDSLAILDSAAIPPKLLDPILMPLVEQVSSRVPPKPLPRPTAALLPRCRPYFALSDAWSPLPALRRARTRRGRAAWPRTCCAIWSTGCRGPSPKS